MNRAVAEVNKDDVSGWLSMAEVTALSFVQCLDTVGWVTRKAHGLEKWASLIPKKVLFLDNWRKKTTWKMTNACTPTNHGHSDGSSNGGSKLLNGTKANQQVIHTFGFLWRWRTCSGRLAVLNSDHLGFASSSIRSRWLTCSSPAVIFDGDYFSFASTASSDFSSFRRGWCRSRWRLFNTCLLGLLWRSSDGCCTFTHENNQLHPFSSLFSTTTWVSRHEKGKPFWILMKQEMMGGSGISWTICR